MVKTENEFSLNELLHEMIIIQESRCYGTYKIIGKVKDEHAIITFIPPTFTKDDMLILVRDAFEETKTLNNDAYSCYDINSTAKFEVRVIYPASKEEVRKHTRSNFIFENESYENYCSKIKEIKETEKDKENWIKNIFDNVSHIDNYEVFKENIGDVVEVGVALNKEEIQTFESDENIKHVKLDNNNSNSKMVVMNKIINQDFLKMIEKEITTITNQKGKSSFMKEKIFYNDKNFTIIPNYQWNCKTVDQLYLIVLFKQENLRTIRDINDVELLKLSKEKAIQACNYYFGLKEENLYMFFHHHPSYYSLHLHVCNSNFYCPSSDVGKAILFEDVLNNLITDIDFYKKINMRVKIKEKN